MAAQERTKKAQQQQEEANNSASAATEYVPSPPHIDSVPKLQEFSPPPPPTFDTNLLPPQTMPQQQQPPPPPSFASIQAAPPSIVAPTAPAFEDLLDTHSSPAAATHGFIQPVLPPSFTEAAAPLGAEDVWSGLGDAERKELMDEQRTIMEGIERDNAANTAAIAQVQAEGFEMRSGTAAAQAAAGGNAAAGGMTATRGVIPGTEEEATTKEDARSHMVDLGGGRQVSLHGQDRTKKAIADGTAILVQCMNCTNWMQVTDNATLMYCPVCSVVSPVMKQDSVITREEAVQLTNDRKMAEQLQKQLYTEGDERPKSKSRSTGIGSTGTSTAGKPEEESWWESVTSVFSYGSGLKNETVAPGIQVKHPPERQGEAVGLLGGPRGSPAAGGGAGIARVAERQPLFNCVVDSVSSAATSVGSALTSTTLRSDQEGNIHGIDASSLLSVTSASRDTHYKQLNGSDE